MTDPAAIAAGLTPAMRRYLLRWPADGSGEIDTVRRRGDATGYRVRSAELAEWVDARSPSLLERLTPLGRAVRAHLSERGRDG